VKATRAGEGCWGRVCSDVKQEAATRWKAVKGQGQMDESRGEDPDDERRRWRGPLFGRSVKAVSSVHTPNGVKAEPKMMWRWRRRMQWTSPEE
jgi:hypothetical protein